MQCTVILCCYVYIAATQWHYVDVHIHEYLLPEYSKSNTIYLWLSAGMLIWWFCFFITAVAYIVIPIGNIKGCSSSIVLYNPCCSQQERELDDITQMLDHLLVELTELAINLYNVTPCDYISLFSDFFLAQLKDHFIFETKMDQIWIFLLQRG